MHAQPGTDLFEQVRPDFPYSSEIQRRRVGRADGDLAGSPSGVVAVRFWRGCGSMTAGGRRRPRPRTCPRVSAATALRARRPARADVTDVGAGDGAARVSRRRLTSRLRPARGRFGDLSAATGASPGFVGLTARSGLPRDRPGARLERGEPLDERAELRQVFKPRDADKRQLDQQSPVQTASHPGPALRKDL